MLEGIACFRVGDVSFENWMMISEIQDHRGIQ